MCSCITMDSNLSHRRRGSKSYFKINENYSGFQFKIKSFQFVSVKAVH